MSLRAEENGCYLFSKKANCEHLKREQQYKVWQDGYHAEHIYKIPL